MMKINAAPLIHARTAYVDFRHDLLFVPQDWRESNVQWARKFITQSTNYIELMHSNGRRLVFSDGNYIVTGISIYIAELYKLCGKEACEYACVDGRRDNYAFIGLVMHNSELSDVFDVPLLTFLGVYEEYISKRWDEPESNKSWENVKAPYISIDLPEAIEVVEATTVGEKVTRTDVRTDRIAQADINVRDAIAAGALSEILVGNRNFSFCSDMPNARSIEESSFQLVTSTNAKAVLRKINGEIKEEPGNTNYSLSREDAFRPRGFSRSDEANEGNFKRQDKQKFVIIAVIVIGVIVAALVIGFVLGRKSSFADTMEMLSQVYTLFINFIA